MKTLDLGILPYRDAWDRQVEIHEQVQAGGEERILLVEHPPVITLGRRAEDSRSHVLAKPHELRNMGVELVESDRGGDVTFHGPGQLVAYPIVELKRHGLTVGKYMRRLQEAVVRTLALFHLESQLDDTAPGVWCDTDQTLAKVAAVGVRVRRGVTLHGLALNVETPLHYFHLIDPCGLGRPVTSMKHVLGNGSPSLLAVKSVLSRELKAGFADDAMDETKETE